PLGLHGRRQLVEHLERLGPVALGLVDGYQLIERRVPVLARSRQLLEDTLGPVHESRALIVERQSERGLVAQAWTAVIAQARMKRDGAIDLAAAPEQASQRELHLGGIALSVGGHACEDLSGVIEAVVDEVVEAHVVVARQPHGARRAVAAAEKPGGEPDEAAGSAARSCGSRGSRCARPARARRS